MRLVSTFSCSRISRQASAIDSATPLGLQAPGLMITSASRKRLPWGRFGSDMSDVFVKERGCSLRPQPDARLHVEPPKIWWILSGLKTARLNLCRLTNSNISNFDSVFQEVRIYR